MKKILAALALSSLCVASTNAITHTNKTFMSVPTPHDYLPMKQTSWHRIIKQGSQDEHPFGGTLQIVPFYRTSNRESSLGKYFGTNGKNELTVAPPGPNVDVQTSLIAHRHDTVSPFSDLIKLNPEHTTCGAYFSYQQDLDKLNNRLFLRFNIPVVEVTNDLHLTNTSPDKDTVTNKNILDFFNGTFKQTDVENLQEPLTSAKIDGPNKNSGVADVECMLGYMLTEKEEYEMSGHIKVVLPTGNEPTGEYLFEAIVGNGKHWGIGAGIDAALNISKSETDSFEFLAHLDYTYLFREDEKRTIGFRNGINNVGPGSTREDLSVVLPWFQYVLGGENGKMGTLPLANILTRHVSVLPGSKLQGHASFAYHRNDTTFDFGYSFFAQEGEKVRIKSWTDDKYAPAAPGYDTSNAFDMSNANQVLGGWINASELDPELAATPAILKHSIHGSIAYTHSDWKNPFMLAGGFSVDWTQDNATPTGYTLWGKVGVSF